MSKKSPQPSPYFDASDPTAQFKAQLLSQLDMLLLPRPVRHTKGICNRECHILERNHTVELVRTFIRENAANSL